MLAGHSHTTDGTIVAGGGDWANSFLSEGRWTIRTWGKDDSAWTVRPESLAYPHCERAGRAPRGCQTAGASVHAPAGGHE